MNKLYLRKVLHEDKTIDLNYEFEENTDGQKLNAMDEVIRKFNKAIKVFEKNEVPD